MDLRVRFWSVAMSLLSLNQEKEVGGGRQLTRHSSCRSDPSVTWPGAKGCFSNKAGTSSHVYKTIHVLVHIEPLCLCYYRSVATGMFTVQNIHFLCCCVSLLLALLYCKIMSPNLRFSFR
jgi:hypothetical protein